MSDETLAAAVPEEYRPAAADRIDRRRADSLHYHEGYHNGQIGLLRRIAGKRRGDQVIQLADGFCFGPSCTVRTGSANHCH